MSAYQPLNNWMAEMAIPAIPTNRAIQEINSARFDRLSECLELSTSSLVSFTCSLVNSTCGFAGIFMFGVTGLITSLMNSAFLAYSSINGGLNLFGISFPIGSSELAGEV